MPRDDDDFNRLDAEWLGLNAIREAIGIGSREGGVPSYGDAFGLGRVLAPGLFDPDVSPLARAQEPQVVREFRQRADAESTLLSGRVSPLDVLERQISDDEKLLEAPGGQRDQIKSRLAKLRRAREWLEEQPYSEHKLIERDVYVAARPNLPSPPIQRDKYVEYPLPNERALRIRLLHPDRPEYSTGADLLYEFCDEQERRVRLAFVQYKIWDGQNLRFSQASNLDAQLQRLSRLCCDGGLCKPVEEGGPPDAYRLPYCAAFLRPTDRLQHPEASLVSSGLHVPVCVARALSLNEVGGRILRRDPLRSKGFSQQTFDELFNRNMLGSNWMRYEDVEALYREHHIFNASERIIVHAQEFTP